MKTIFINVEGIHQFINAMEASQRKYKHAEIVINDEYMHAVALKLLLQSAEYETETQEWSKLPEDKQTWLEWKTTFRAAYVAKRRTEAAIEGEEKPFGVSSPSSAASAGLFVKYASLKVAFHAVQVLCSSGSFNPFPVYVSDSPDCSSYFMYILALYDEF